MSINLKKNEGVLQAAYQDVLKDSTDTNWAVFGYEGTSNNLKVVETGDGGLDELMDEMSGGKVLYAFLRVTDPNTQLPKNVLINWQGEGVPATRKGVYARHTPDVARFFRGAHVTINARSEMDLEEDSILEKVAKASGANFGFHKEKARPMPEQGPVGSVYKRADPRADISSRARDQFWSKQEQDEEHRRAAERKAAAEERRELEVQRRQNETEQGRAREKAAEERGRTLEEQRRRERERQSQDLKAKEETLQQRLKQEESAVEAERQRERDDLRRQRVQEYKTISSAVSSKKAGFEQPAEEAPSLPQRPAKKPAKRPPARPVPQPEPEPEPEPEQEWEPEPEPEQQWEEPEPEPEQQWEEPEPEPEQQPEQQLEQQWEPEPEQQWEEPEPEPDQPLYDDVEQSPPEPEQPLYDDVQENQGYQQEEPEPEQDLYDDVRDELAPAEPESIDREGEGLTATTIYDYQAEDEGELTFDENERITNIEQIDEGWWRGTRELDGSYGIFPANYVELIQ